MRKKGTIKSLRFDLNALGIGFHKKRITGYRIGFEAYVFRGGKGPVLLVSGGTHGDEYEGPTLLMQWAQHWRPNRLSGTIVLVPVLNEVAFLAGARNRPDDGKNLARSFPGRSNGSPTSRLARLFDEQMLSQCTHYIDLHSAGTTNELLPWVGYMMGESGPVERCQKKMAECFDRFWLVGTVPSRPHFERCREASNSGDLH
jgi:predicted deacylase